MESPVLDEWTNSRFRHPTRKAYSTTGTGTAGAYGATGDLRYGWQARQGVTD